MTLKILLDASNTKVVAYPYTEYQLRQDNPGITFPEFMSAADFAAQHVFDVVSIPQPTETTDTKWVEHDPVYSAGEWKQNWVAVALEPDQQAARLKNARSYCLNKVKATRQRLNTQGSVKVDSDWYSTDLMSRSKYQDMLLKVISNNLKATDVLTDPNGDVNWKLMDNRFAVMTVTRLKSVVKAIEHFDAAVFKHSEKLKADIQASDNPMSLSLDKGWPKIYKAA